MLLGREEEYKVWFENAAALALEKLSSPGVAIFYQAYFENQALPFLKTALIFSKLVRTFRLWLRDRVALQTDVEYLDVCKNVKKQIANVEIFAIFVYSRFSIYSQFFCSPSAAQQLLAAGDRKRMQTSRYSLLRCFQCVANVFFMPHYCRQTSRYVQKPRARGLYL